MRTAHLMTVAALTFAAAGTAMASPLGLTPTIPDASAGFIAIQYTAQTGLFVADGFTQNLNQPAQGLGNRQYTLTAHIDPNGVPFGAASLLLRGDYLGTDQVMFQSGRLAAFGFADTAPVFEFIFLQDSGNLAPVNAQIGVILTDFNLAFPGQGGPIFTADFSDVGGGGLADNFIVPAPSAAGLLCIVGGLAARRRRA